MTSPGVDDYLGFTVSDSAFSWIVRKILEIHTVADKKNVAFFTSKKKLFRLNKSI